MHAGWAVQKAASALSPRHAPVGGTARQRLGTMRPGPPSRQGCSDTWSQTGGEASLDPWAARLHIRDLSPPPRVCSSYVHR